MTTLTFSGNNVLLTFLFILLSIIFIVLFFKYYLRNTPSDFKKKSIFHYNFLLRSFGICVALMIVLALMSWTTYNIKTYDISPAIDWDEDVLEVSPRTADIRKVKKIMPPPTPTPIIIPVDDIQVEVEPDLLPMEIPLDAVISDDEYAPSTIKPTEDLPVPLPPDPIESEPDFFVVAEQMPRFPGCEQLDMSNDEKKSCSEKKLYNYIASNLKYPSIARSNGIEGRVFVQFIVDKNGNLTDIEVVRDIGAGCGKEALRVIENMIADTGYWTPGMQRGRKVKVKYTLPIYFKLGE